MALPRSDGTCTRCPMEVGRCLSPCCIRHARLAPPRILHPNLSTQETPAWAFLSLRAHLPLAQLPTSYYNLQVRMSDAPPEGGGSWGATVKVRREWDAAGAVRLPAAEEVVVQVRLGC